MWKQLRPISIQPHTSKKHPNIMKTKSFTLPVTHTNSPTLCFPSMLLRKGILENKCHRRTSSDANKCFFLFLTTTRSLSISSPVWEMANAINIRKKKKLPLTIKDHQSYYEHSPTIYMNSLYINDEESECMCLYLLNDQKFF